MDIEKLRHACETGKMKWTLHIVDRLSRRGIDRVDVKQAIINGEVIEDYSEDTPYPSCLLLGYGVSGTALHVVCGFDCDIIWLISVYTPDNEKWDDDFKVRRRN